MNGEQHGEGILKMADGRAKEGIFQHNKFIESRPVKLVPSAEESSDNE